MYVCICKQVTDSQIKTAVKSGCCTLKQLSQCLKLGTECGQCCCLAKDILGQALIESPRSNNLNPQLSGNASQ